MAKPRVSASGASGRAARGLASLDDSAVRFARQGLRPLPRCQKTRVPQREPARRLVLDLHHLLSCTFFKIGKRPTRWFSG